MYTVCIAASNPTFIDPIAQELTSKYKIRTFYNHDIRQQDQYLFLMEHIRDADITLFDWCDPYIMEMSKGIKTAKMICRLHSYEFFSGYPGQVNWDNVDKLILVNHSLAELMHSMVSLSTKKMSVVYHGIDLNKFQFNPERKRTNRVGVAGFVNYKKDPSYIFTCFHEIYKACPEISFVWAGTHQDPRYHLSLLNDGPRFIFPFTFMPWQEDMNAWLQGVDYVISGSLFESCHLTILEGMACGAFPLVRFWNGADNIYPTHSLFTMPDQCAQKVMFYQKHPNPIDFAVAHRKWVADNFPFAREVEQIDDIIQEVLHA